MADDETRALWPVEVAEVQGVDVDSRRPENAPEGRQPESRSVATQQLVVKSECPNPVGQDREDSKPPGTKSCARQRLQPRSHPGQLAGALAGLQRTQAPGRQRRRAATHR